MSRAIEVGQRNESAIRKYSKLYCFFTILCINPCVHIISPETVDLMWWDNLDIRLSIKSAIKMQIELNESNTNVSTYTCDMLLKCVHACMQCMRFFTSQLLVPRADK